MASTDTGVDVTKDDVTKDDVAKGDVAKGDAPTTGEPRPAGGLAGLEAGMRTFLVLTGVTRRDEVDRYSYQPNQIVESLADLELE